MLERKYEPSTTYRYARYGRMSDPRQNRRSPDQQFDTIEATHQRCGYPWTCVASYRDDGISGRYLRKRLGLQNLLRDIEARLIRIDLIAVDTLERLGRADEIVELRRRLFVDHGVLVVAADTGFSDPTGIVGKAVGLVEQIRSTENTRISRHNVIRGKKDAARRGRWPGGPPPFGFRLKRVVDEATDPAETFNVLETEPREALALRLAFERAAATGEGDLRLSRWWNSSSEIPEDLKPISPYTMGYRLENPIAVGTLRWGAHRTAIVSDTRVIEPSPEEAETIEGFCPAAVDSDLYRRVQDVRRRRADAVRQARTAPRGDPQKRIAPQGRGLTLKYILSGMVRCGSCRSSMRPLASGRRSAAGKRYVYFVCPRHQDGACNNGEHVPEDRLRKAVIGCVRARLFPDDVRRRGPWVEELRERALREVQRIRENGPNRNAVDQDELRRLERQLNGWGQSLANPDLPATLRRDLETKYEAAHRRKQSVDDRLAKTPGFRRAPWVAEDDMSRELGRLDLMLVEHNPTAVNVELTRHISAVIVEADGRIELRGSRLGVLGETIVVLRTTRPNVGPTAATPHPKVVPRRRGRLRSQEPLSAETVSVFAPHNATPSDGDVVEESEFGAIASESVDWSRSWSERNAAEVSRRRRQGCTHARLAEDFGVSVPTIRKALKLAGADSDASLPRKVPRARWPERHYREVAECRRQGMTLQEICDHFDRSEPLIRQALRLAVEGDGEDSKADGPADTPRARLDER